MTDPARAAGPAHATVMLLAVLALAAALRLAGLGFGLPAVYNPDEIAIMSRALAFATGDLNPHNFVYPSFYFYALFGWIGFSFAAGWLTGSVESIAAFQREFFTDPTRIYLAGRLLGAVCGTATVGLVYRLGRRLFDARVGLAAAFFLAVSPLHVRDSHYVKHDVFVTLLIVLAALAAARIWPVARGGRTSDTVTAGAFWGAATSTHYYAVFLGVLVAAAVGLRHGATRIALRHLVLASAVAALAFFLLSPFILVEPATAWRDIVANRQIVVDRALSGSSDPIAGAARYGAWLWLDALGWPVAALATLGFGWLLARSPRHAIVLLAFPLPFLLFIVNTVPASRYLIPALPMLVIAAAAMVAALGTAVSAGRAGAVVLVATLAAGAPGLAASIGVDRFFQQTDTRTLAQAFIEANVPAGSTVLVQPYSVQLHQSRDSLREALQHHLGDERRATTKFAIRLALEPQPEPSYRTLYLGEGGLDVDKIFIGQKEASGENGLEPLRRHGVRYVVVKRSDDDPRTERFVATLAKHGRMMSRHSPYRDGTPEERPEPFLHNTNARIHPALVRPGPVVEIWEIREKER